MKRRIAVYIDGIVRKPNVQKSLIYFGSLVKNLMEPVKGHFKDDIDENPIDKVSYYWAEKFKDNDIKEFYYKKFIEPLETIETEEELEEFFEYDINNCQKLFFNKEHFTKFLEDFNYFLFVQGERFNDKFVEYLRLIQQKFELDLIDKIQSDIQPKHTIKFLSKYYFPSKKIVFLYEKENLDESEYDLVLDNRQNSEKFTPEFLLEKLKELECKLTKV